MTTRFLSILFVVLPAVAVVAEAQQPKKVPLIGYLSSGTAVSESTRSKAIRQALREFDYIEGQNIAFEYRYSEGKVERAPELAAELVRRNTDIISNSSGGGMDPGGAECNKNDSHRNDGHRERSCRGRVS